MTLELPGMPADVDSAHVVRQMLRRAGSPSFKAWWAKVEDAGFCSNPIHLAGADGVGREHQVFTRCNNRRAIVCPSCSDLYARDTWQLIHAGLHGGHHNIPTTVAEHPQVFVTLTAPSFGAVHTSGQTAVARRQTPAAAAASTRDACPVRPPTTTTTQNLGSRCVASAPTTWGKSCSPGRHRSSGGASRFGCAGCYANSCESVQRTQPLHGFHS
jgi:hypothetical protein